MVIPMVNRNPEAKCPDCGSDALYKYGKTRFGKQRFLCLMCKRQFTWPSERVEWKERPVCSSCGAPMHFFMKKAGYIRFRCSNYPKCRTFLKVDLQEE